MSSAQRPPWDKMRECHRRHSTIARQLFVTQQEGSLAGEHTFNTDKRKYENVLQHSSQHLEEYRTVLLNIVQVQLQHSAKTSAFKKVFHT